VIRDIVSTVVYNIMSSFNPLSTVKFDEDPTANYHDMEVAMETLAGTLCCELYDTGLAESTCQTATI
jgi:hypothetical protein